MTAPLSEPDADRRAEAEPTGPICSRCGKRAESSAEEMVFIPTGETICPTLYSCPTDGEFYEDREGWSTRQVFLGDSVPDMPVYCCEDFELGRPCDCRDSFLDEEEQVEF